MAAVESDYDHAYKVVFAPDGTEVPRPVARPPHPGVGPLTAEQAAVLVRKRIH